MNKYYQVLDKILATGKTQSNRKGNIQYLLNEVLVLTPADLLDIFEGHHIARKKLRNELHLFMQGERQVENTAKQVSTGGIIADPFCELLSHLF